MGPTLCERDYAKIGHLESEVSELQDMLESKYLRYCGFVVPSHCMAMAMARGTPCMARFRLRLPKARAQALTVEESTDLCNTALRILDYTVVSRVNPLVRRFSWHISAYSQFEPVIWIVTELRNKSPTIVDPQSIWEGVQTLYTEWPEFMRVRRTLYVVVARLMLKA